MTHPYTVALTGGIASGKTAFARLLAGLGAVVIDADQVGHQLTGSDPILDADLRRAIGNRYFNADGTLDRRRLRTALTEDPGLRNRLETVLHPRIWSALAEAVASAEGNWVLVEIPLLAESVGDWHLLIDRVLVVDCRVETQIGRLVTRDRLSPEAARGLVALQASRLARLALADDLVINEGALEALQEPARTLVHDYAEQGAARGRQAGSGP